MTSLAVSVLFIGSSLGGMLYQWITGFLVQYRGHESLFYVILFHGINVFIVHGIMQFLASRHGDRFLRSNDDTEEREIAKSRKKHVEDDVILQHYSSKTSI